MSFGIQTVLKKEIIKKYYLKVIIFKMNKKITKSFNFKRWIVENWSRRMMILTKNNIKYNR